jgi:hypothetical protein
LTKYAKEQDKLAKMKEKTQKHLRITAMGLADREHQYMCRTISMCAKPLRTEYIRMLDVMGNGPMEASKWRAWRAGGGWMRLVHELEDVLRPGTGLERLSLNADDVGQNRLELALDLTSQLIRFVAWRHLPYSNCLPSLFSTVHDPAYAEKGMMKARLIFETLLDAKRVSMTGPPDIRAALAKVLKCVYFSRQPLTLLLCAYAQEGEWRSDDVEVQTIMRSLDETIVNTKFNLEDAIGHLKDKCTKNANRVMGRYQSYYHLANRHQLSNPSNVVGDKADRFSGQSRGHVYEHFVLPASDYSLPMDVSTSKIEDGVFQAGDHQLSDCGLEELLREKGQDTTFQPAGPAASKRMTTAVELLLQQRPHGYVDVAKSIFAGFFGHGLVFLEVETKRPYLALGSSDFGFAALELETKTIDVGTAAETCVFYFVDGTARVEEATSVTIRLNLSAIHCQYMGIPTKAIELKDMGISWCQTADAMDVVPFAIQHSVKMSQDLLKQTCKELGLEPKVGKKEVTRAFATALVEHFFAGEDTAYKRMLVDGIVNGKPKAALNASYSDSFDIWELLDDKIKVDFDDVKTMALKGLVDRAAANASHTRDANGPRCQTFDYTPAALKDLIPERGMMQGCYLCWQRSKQSFHGYYPGATPTSSTSRGWGGPRTTPHEHIALHMVVAWLWNQHAKLNECCDGRPTMDTIRNTLAVLAAPAAAPGAAPAAAPAAVLGDDVLMVDLALPRGRGAARGRAVGGRGRRAGGRRARGRG